GGGGRASGGRRAGAAAPPRGPPTPPSPRPPRHPPPTAPAGDDSTGPGQLPASRSRCDPFLRSLNLDPRADSSGRHREPVETRNVTSATDKHPGSAQTAGGRPLAPDKERTHAQPLAR